MTNCSADTEDMEQKEQHSSWGTDLHHDDGKRYGEARDAAHEGARTYEREGPRVHPRPGAWRKEYPQRCTAGNGHIIWDCFLTSFTYSF